MGIAVGYKGGASTDPLVGVSPELLQSEVQKITDVFEKTLSDSGRRAECEKKNVRVLPKPVSVSICLKKWLAHALNSNSRSVLPTILCGV